MVVFISHHFRRGLHELANRGIISERTFERVWHAFFVGRAFLTRRAERGAS